LVSPVGFALNANLFIKYLQYNIKTKNINIYEKSSEVQINVKIVISRYAGQKQNVTSNIIRLFTDPQSAGDV